MKQMLLGFVAVFIISSVASAQFELIKDLGGYCRYVDNDKYIASIKFNPRAKGIFAKSFFINANDRKINFHLTGYIGSKYSADNAALVDNYGVNVDDTLGACCDLSCDYLDGQGNFYAWRGNYVLLDKLKKFGDEIVYYKKNPITGEEYVPTGTEFYNFEPKLKAGIQMPDYQGEMEISHSGKYVAAGRSFFRSSSRDALCRLTSQDYCFSRNDKMIASFRSSEITLFRTDSGAQLMSLSVPLQAQIKKIVFTHDNASILAICKADASRFKNSSEKVFENLSPGDSITGSYFYFISEFNVRDNSVKHRKIEFNGDFNDYLDIDPKRRFISVGNRIYSYETLGLVFTAGQGKKGIHYTHFSSDGTRFLCGGYLYKIHSDSSHMQELFK